MGLLDGLIQAGTPSPDMAQPLNYMSSGYNISPYTGGMNTDLFTPSIGLNDIGLGGATPELYGGNQGGLLGGLMGDMNLGDIAGLASGIFGIIQGNKQFGLLEDVLTQQLGMAKEKWGMTKDELARVNAVRNNLNTGYQAGNYAPSPRAKTYGQYS